MFIMKLQNFGLNFWVQSDIRVSKDADLSRTYLQAIEELRAISLQQ